MTTLKDLSRHLGLSVTQVSRAFNNHGDVAEETRQRVHEAAKKLNYQPNLSARRLVTGRSGIVGLILHGIPRRSVSALYMQLLGGMSEHFGRNGMHFMLHVADKDENTISVYRRLTSGGSLDGLALFEPSINDQRIAFLQSKGIPFVLHGRTVPEPDYPYFDIDNEWVGYALTRLLIEHGHRHVAFLNGEIDRTYAKARHQGYLRALAEKGIQPIPSLHRCGQMTESLGLRETVHLLTGKGPKPTSFIAGNALVAKGIYTALRALDLTVPSDVSVVAHDDMLPDVKLSLFDPAVTCTRSPLEHSWKPLAEFLVGAVRGRPIEELQQVEMPELVVRDSVASPAR